MMRASVWWSLRAVGVAGLVVVGVGCFLNRAGTATLRLGLPPVTSSVEPTFICPGDPVTLTWDGGPVDGCESVGSDAAWGSGCEETIQRTAVTVESTPDLFAASPVPANETRGSRTVNPSADTSFTVGFTRAAGDLTYSQSVLVDVFDDDDLQPASFPRVCFGGSGRWGALEVRPAGLRPGAGLPARMRIIEVCNPNGFQVDIESIDTATVFRLAGGECTGEIRPTRAVRLDGLDPVAEGVLLFGENCRRTATTEPMPGRPVPMQARLRCAPA